MRSRLGIRRQMTGEDEPSAFKDFDARLGSVRRPGGAPEKGDHRGTKPVGWGDGLQVGIELIAGIVGGALLGWGLDHWFGTKPIFLIVLLLMGAAAGMLNAIRAMRRMQGDGGGRGA